tara:strand:- start:36776 stop:38161 length:1386 start_codon:yes stop_codon:yes gene_type:complete
MLLDQILIHAPCAIFWKDTRGAFLGCNQLFLTYVGLTDDAEIIGKIDAELPWANCADKYRRDDRHVIDTEQTISVIEKIMLPEGELTVKTTKTPLYDNDKVIGILGMFDDITDIIQSKHVAEQAAHDIRSPLAAFNMVLKQLELLPEQQRNMLRDATQRINDIANNLLSLAKQSSGTKAGELRTESLYGLLDNIVSEKRTQFANEHITFNLILANDLYCAFIKVNPVEFKRSLSNLLNNAVEAIAKDILGEVNITVSDVDNNICINVQDNGQGIPKNIINKITETGFSDGKPSGAGLGLTYAIQKTREWQGTFHISSEMNKGTCIILCFPRAKPATWFAEEIIIPKNSTIIVLDDDPFIHQVWDNRLPEHTVKHFHHAEKLIHDLPNHKPRDTVYLVDYELLGSENNGLEFIEKYALSSQSYLVTSQYEDEAIRERCQTLGLKIVPKPYSVHIPIHKELSC